MMCAVQALLLVAAAAAAGDELRMMSTFGDNMVLQSTDDGGAGAVVFGEGCAGDVKITTVPLLGPFAAKGDSTGSFSVELKAKAGGPFNLTLTCSVSGETASATGVYFGDVIVCSGQSNMEFSVRNTDNASGIISDSANYPFIHLFSVVQKFTPDPLSNVTYQRFFPVPISWAKASPNAVVDFSAVCYLTALHISKTRTRTRPLGLIESVVGGTPVEGWVPPSDLRRCDISPNLPIPKQDGAEQGGKVVPDFVWSHPGCLYNQMIGPLVGVRVRSFLWYQGEANMNEGYHLSRHNYFCLFRTMIEAWRREFQQPNAPFNFVQLHSCDSGNTGQCYQDFCNYGDIRMAQDDTWRFLENTGMAVSYDQGHSGIHSPHKEAVAVRLALQTLRTAYADTSVGADGPLVKGACVLTPPTEVGGTNITEVRILLDNADKLGMRPTMECEAQSPDCCTGTAPNLKGVAPGLAQISVGDVWRGQQWYDATVRIDGSSLILAANLRNNHQPWGQEKAPVWQVRYALGAFPSCAVVNSFDIPIRPFGPLAVSPSCHF